MMKSYKPDSSTLEYFDFVDINRVSLFLGGSIEEGKAIDWQTDITNKLSSYTNLDIFNPRRDNWNTDTTQSINDEDFNNQVSWELTCIENCKYAILNFLPNTKSPISLLELGLLSQSNPKFTFVCAPDGFWRKGNIEMVCSRYGITLYTSYEELVDRLINVIDSTQ